MRKKVVLKIKEAESLVLLSDDGWKDINGISLGNILFCTPMPIFFRIIEKLYKRKSV